MDILSKIKGNSNEPKIPDRFPCPADPEKYVNFVEETQKTISLTQKSTAKRIEIELEAQHKKIEELKKCDIECSECKNTGYSLITKFNQDPDNEDKGKFIHTLTCVLCNHSWEV